MGVVVSNKFDKIEDISSGNNNPTLKLGIH